MEKRSFTTRNPIDRFWSYVSKEDSGCWVWSGPRYKSGYGMLYRDYKAKHGRCVRAHRFSWELSNGKIPEGLSVLHRCDNPPCVNPEHLFLGTQLDNMRDKGQKGRYRKGRVYRGSSCKTAKLNERQVREIRALSSRGVQQREIAAMYGVGKTTVARIQRNESWAHIQPTA